MAAFKDLIASEKPVLIDFYADWCGPCKTMAPYIQEVKANMGDAIKVLKIDVDKNQSLAQSLAIQGIPTLAIYQNGKQMWRQSGVVPPQTIKGELEKLL